jgi:hypothetical protein
MKIELEIYENPYEEFYAYLNDEGKYNLEIGTDFIYSTDSMSDLEILSWAKSYEYLDDPEDGYFLEDGSPDILALRERRKSDEEESPDAECYPSGRAFLFFENLEFDFPDSIGIKIIEGPHPGNDWQGVIVNGEKSLESLQKFLKSKEVQVNFQIVKEF